MGGLIVLPGLGLLFLRTRCCRLKHGSSSRNAALPLSYVGAGQGYPMLKSISFRAHAGTFGTEPDSLHSA